MTQAAVTELLEKVDTLPDIPVVALKITRMLMDEEVDVRAVADTISYDVGLTTKILRLCNSSFYALPRKVATIKEAIAILGIATLKQILFTAISQNVFARSYKGYALEKNELWENAVVCGNCTQILVDYLKVPDDGVGFTAALLRDIGKMAIEIQLSKLSPQEFQQQLQQYQQSFDKVEEGIFGVSHTEVGQALAVKWQLPESLVFSAGYHHKPSLMPEDTSLKMKKLISLVHLADCFTAMLGVGVGVDGLMYSVDKKALEYLGLEAQDLQELYALMIDQPELVKNNIQALQE